MCRADVAVDGSLSHLLHRSTSHSGSTLLSLTTGKYHPFVLSPRFIFPNSHLNTIRVLMLWGSELQSDPLFAGWKDPKVRFPQTGPVLMTSSCSKSFLLLFCLLWPHSKTILISSCSKTSSSFLNPCFLYKSYFFFNNSDLRASFTPSVLSGPDFSQNYWSED
jgi:hypothetical protein